MIDKPRQIALKILYKIEKEGAYSNIALNEVIEENKNELENKDISFISEIVYGTITWKLTIDEIIKKHSSLRLKKISMWILNILRIGIYQIVFLDKIPKRAAVNECVNLAKRYGHKGSSSFVNAILRKVEKEDYEEFFEIKNDFERISKTTSMPLWLVEEIYKSLIGEKEEDKIKQTQEICQNSNIRPKIHIRINKLKTTKEEIKRELNEEKIEVEERILEDFLTIKNARSIGNIKEFQEGKFTIQDEMAGLIAIFLNPKKGEKILDACSSPGGKTTYLAEMMKDEGEILALDVHEHRTKLVEQTAKRLGISIINTKIQDATIYKEEWKEKFDKILLDVPCLGTGVLKRKPDIKWQKKKEDIEEISKVQKEILKTCSRYLKKGGELVYSTCSILKEENQEIIDGFLQEEKEFEIITVPLTIQNILKKDKILEKYSGNEQFIQIFQNEETDGFFMAKLLRK